MFKAKASMHKADEMILEAEEMMSTKRSADDAGDEDDKPPIKKRTFSVAHSMS